MSADPEAPGHMSNGCKVSSGQAQPLKCYGPLKIAMFGPAQRQMPFLTANTADSGLENKDVPILVEKLD